MWIGFSPTAPACAQLDYSTKDWYTASAAYEGDSRLLGLLGLLG